MKLSVDSYSRKVLTQPCVHMRVRLCVCVMRIRVLMDIKTLQFDYLIQIIDKIMINLLEFSSNTMQKKKKNDYYHECIHAFVL